MIPLLEPYITENAHKYIKDCLDTGWISYAGQYVKKLEESVEDIVGNGKKAVALNSGTGGLYLALKLMGIGPGCVVAVPSMTFVATVNAIRQVGAIPIFIGCDETLCMKPSNLEYALSCAGNKISAVIPVHLLGSICDMDEIMRLSVKYNVIVIEDAAQALGSSLDGQPAGTFGDIGVFSFSFNKMITAGGGGMLIADKYIAERAKYLALQAKDSEELYIHNESGYNLGMGNISAALALSQLENIELFKKAKQEIYRRYESAFAGSDKINMIPTRGESNNWLSAVEIKTDRRDAVPHRINLMKHMGIQVRPLFRPNHKQEAFKGYNYVGTDIDEDAYRNVLCLPSSVRLTEDDQLHVIESVKTL